MEEEYATKIQHDKSTLYGECNAGVSLINKEENWELWIPGSTQRIYPTYSPHQD